ncbi:MAG: hypothetical protein FRX49_01081 [Trebouxia sp. A1-2]|nr:MAG: hypothetical protein FRX49_01081 [Trebouxia sp. A1-2]
MSAGRQRQSYVLETGLAQKASHEKPVSKTSTEESVLTRRDLRLLDRNRKQTTLNAMNSKHTGNKAGNAEVVKSSTDQAWNRLFQKGGQAFSKLNNNGDEATA